MQVWIAMNNDLIFLGDLTHTSQGYAAELTPYPIGCLKSYLLEYSGLRSGTQVDLFKDPQMLIDSFLELQPGVVGFSNYMWNLDLSYEIAKRIKAVYPETLIIFGGPNYPLEDHNRESWLLNHPAVDVYIIGEGEQPFTELTDLWRKNRDIAAALKEGMSGCHSLVNGSLVKSDDKSPRITELDSIPSPYLKGYMDEFLKEVPLTPLLETNRGCPFTCTFCVDGIQDRTKVHRKTLARFEEELEYIAQRYEGKVLTLADLNFGMYLEDLETARVIGRIREQYEYPEHLQVTTGKNQNERVLECADILGGSLRLGASVQSLAPDVLANIKRTSISTEKLIQVTKQANRMDANSYSEVILGLPGDSKEKHFNTVLQLADAGLKFIPLYTLMMLEGTELSKDESRERWDLRSKYRVVFRCFGDYKFGDEELLSAEFEEVCVQSDSLPYQDYLECRSMALTMGLFYQDRIMFELYGFLNNFGIKPSDVLKVLHERRMEMSDGITGLYKSFGDATHDELWDSKEELEAFTKSSKDVIQQYIAGELGNNVLFRHRAMAFLDLIDEVHAAAFKVAGEILEDTNPSARKEYAAYLDELALYSASRKRNVFELDARYSEEFNYDFPKLVAEEFEGLPEKLDAPVTLNFYASEETKGMIRFQQSVQGSDLNGTAKIVSRIPCAKLQRAVDFDGKTSDSDGSRSGEFSGAARLSPGEFT